MKTVLNSFKKGQMGMMEMIMVMAVVMILLVVGLIFYFKFQISNIKEIGGKISEEKTNIVLTTVAQLPEIECSTLGSRITRACADTLKLLALSQRDVPSSPYFQEHRRHYSNLFGYKKIVFEQLYPPPKSTQECTPKMFSDIDYPLGMICGKWTIYNNPRQGTDPYFKTMPLVLYFPSKGMYTFGRVKVYFYD